jgi:hypothetical protein
MLVRISNLTRFHVMRIACFLCVAIALASCATRETALIADPGASRETALPWNEQQKWERDGSAAGLNTEGRR